MGGTRRGFGASSDTSGIPENLVEAIEHLVRRQIRDTLALPIQGKVVKVKPETNSVDVKPILGMPVITDIPCTVAPHDKAAKGGGSGAFQVSMRPKLGSLVIVSFLDGIREYPVLTWVEEVSELLVSAELTIYLVSKGMISIVSPILRLNGRSVEPNDRPI